MSRVGWLGAGLYALLAGPFFGWFIADVQQGGLGFGLAAGATFGLVGALLVPWSARRSLLRRYNAFLDGYYAEDGAALAGAPADAARFLPCSMIAGRVGIGGTLYELPQELVFVPNRRNPGKLAEPVHIAIEGCRFELEAVRPTGFHALLRLRPVNHLVICSSCGAARFLVPASETVLKLLAGQFAGGARHSS